ncbi:hypothetical protein ACHAWC_007297 [Mediolabrus comicus]
MVPVVALLGLSTVANTFCVIPPPQRHHRQCLFASTESDAVYDDADDAGDASKLISIEDVLFLERFKRRRNAVVTELESERLKKPPSNATHFEDPKNVVTSILNGLLHPHTPAPLFGYEVLYQASTQHWQNVLRRSVGAPNNTEVELIYRALSTSMERKQNQFGILVGLGTDVSLTSTDNSNTNNAYDEEYYTIEFPWDTLDYYDGTAWLECRLRDKQSDSLLVVLGWSLERSSDGAWLIDGIDWQDFRERYRPGVGREEWERICG